MLYAVASCPCIAARSDRLAKRESPHDNCSEDLFPDGWKQSTRYPDPAITALDPRFEKYWVKLAVIERLATGCRWAEGPVWFGDGRYLLWSDIPNNRILRWDEETGAVSASGSRPTTPMATRATGRAGSSPASTGRAASRAPSTMAPSPC